MSFLNSSYFWGTLRLPMLNARSEAVGISSQGTISTQEILLKEYIDTFEPEFLLKLLGDSLYENFMEGISKTSPEKIWVDLRDMIFRDSGIKNYPNPISPCANYVYVMIRRETKSLDMLKGNGMQQVSSVTHTNDNRKMVDAWNRMLRYVYEIYDFIDENEDYSQYKGDSYRRYDFGVMNDYGI